MLAKCWLKENMNIGTRINSCTAGPCGTNCLSTCTARGTTVNDQTNNGIIEKYCYADNESKCDTNGGLYQWAEAMQYKNGCSNTNTIQPTHPTQGICPTGWHIPSDSEWHNLEQTLTSPGNSCDANRNDAYDCFPAGARLKVGGSSGFELKITGWRIFDGRINNEGGWGWYLCGTDAGGTAAPTRIFYASSDGISRRNESKLIGAAVRCIKD